MVARSKLVFVCYAVGLVIFFGGIELYLSGREQVNVPAFVEWLGIPGNLLAAYCLVGVHSNHFVLAAFLANIAVYLLVPWLLWRLFVFWKGRPGPGQPK